MEITKVVQPTDKTIEKIVGKVPTSQEGTQTGVEPEKKVEAEPTKVEPAKEEPKKATIEDYSEKIAELSKKDQYLSKREKEIKDREKKLEGFEGSKPTSVLGAFKAMGLTFEQGLQKAIDEVGGEKEPDVKDQIKALEQRLIAKDKAEEAEKAKIKAQEEQEAVEDFVERMVTHVKAAGEKYELVNQLESYDLVYSVIDKYFAANNKILEFDAAAEEVEKYLEAQTEKVTKTKKFSSKFATPPKATVKKENVTLSNNLNAQTTNVVSGSKFQSREDSLKRAAAMLKWKE